MSNSPNSLPDFNNCAIAVIGLGYVGLPLAVSFAKTKNCFLTNEKLERKVLGFDINKKLINFCKNNKDFKSVKFSISPFPFNDTDYVVMSGTYNLTPTNNVTLWEDYIIKNLTNNWKFAKKAMIFNCLYKEKRTINKSLYYTELSWIKKICEENFCHPIISKHQMLKEDITVIVKR